MTDYQIAGVGAIRNDDGTCIPPDPENRDWCEYLAWLAEGNEPDLEPEPELQPEPTEEDVIKQIIKMKIDHGIALTEDEIALIAGGT